MIDERETPIEIRVVPIAELLVYIDEHGNQTPYVPSEFDDQDRECDFTEEDVIT
jgi:hypothetical protein